MFATDMTINDKNICIRTHRYLLEPFNEKSNFPHNKLPTRSIVHVVDNIVGRLFPMYHTNKCPILMTRTLRYPKMADWNRPEDISCFGDVYPGLFLNNKRIQGFKILLSTCFR